MTATKPRFYLTFEYFSVCSLKSMYWPSQLMTLVFNLLAVLSWRSRWSWPSVGDDLPSSEMTATELRTLLSSLWIHHSQGFIVKVHVKSVMKSALVVKRSPESVKKRHGNQEQSTDFHNFWTGGGAKPTDLYEFLDRRWYPSNRFFAFLHRRWCRTKRFYWFAHRQ